MSVCSSLFVKMNCNSRGISESGSSGLISGKIMLPIVLRNPNSALVSDASECRIACCCPVTTDSSSGYEWRQGEEQGRPKSWVRYEKSCWVAVQTSKWVPGETGFHPKGCRASVPESSSQANSWRSWSRLLPRSSESAGDGRPEVGQMASVDSVCVRGSDELREVMRQPS